jgi:hypothetical protein
MPAKFTNLDYTQDGKIGVNLFATYSAAAAFMSGPLIGATPGERVHTSNNGEYLFARAHTLCSISQCCVAGPYQTSAAAVPTMAFVPATTTLIGAVANGFNVLGWPAATIAASSWGWFQTNGIIGAKVATGTNPGLPLYVSGTAGVIGNTTTSTGLIQGLIAAASCTGGPSIIACFGSHVHLFGHRPI